MGIFYFIFFYPFYNVNVSLFYRRAVLLLSEITKKKCQTLFFLVQLKHAKVPPEELVQLYVACIKFVLFFGCQVSCLCIVAQSKEGQLCNKLFNKLPENPLDVLHPLKPLKEGPSKDLRNSTCMLYHVKSTPS